MKYEGKKSSKFKNKRLIKTLVIIFTLVLLSVIGIYYFQSYKVDPQKTSVLQAKPTVTEPADIDEEVSLDKFPEDFKAIALKDLSDKESDGEYGPGISGFPYDLNGDGISEWIITGVNWGGSGSQTYFIYLKNNGNWIRIGETCGRIASIGPSKTKGFYDIFVGVRSYSDKDEKACNGGMAYDLYKYTWNGNKYKGNQTGKACG